MGRYKDKKPLKSLTSSYSKSNSISQIHNEKNFKISKNKYTLSFLKFYLKNDNLNYLLTKINLKDRIIDQSYLNKLLCALNKDPLDEEIQEKGLLNSISEKTFEETVLTLYLLLEYGREDLFYNIMFIHDPKKAITYLANIFCKTNDFDNFKKLDEFKNFININSTKITIEKPLDIHPCLTEAIKHKNIKFIEHIINTYTKKINIFAKRSYTNTHQEALKHLSDSLEGLEIIQKIEKIYIKKENKIAECYNNTSMDIEVEETQDNNITNKISSNVIYSKTDNNLDLLLEAIDLYAKTPYTTHYPNNEILKLCGDTTSSEDTD